MFHAATGGFGPRVDTLKLDLQATRGTEFQDTRLTSSALCQSVILSIRATLTTRLSLAFVMVDCRSVAPRYTGSGLPHVQPSKDTTEARFVANFEALHPADFRAV